MSRLHTGIPGFDAVIQGGLPIGANVVLRGPPGPEKLQFALAFLAEGLRSGGSGIVLTASQAAGTVLQFLRGLGVDVERAAREDRLRIIDWYTWSKKAVPEIEEHGIILTAPLDLLEAGTALSRAIVTLSGDAPKRAVIEMLSPAMEVFDLAQVQSFAESARQKLEKHRLTSLFVLEKFWHDTAALAALERPFDGILEIDRSQVGDRVVRRIGVLRLKDTRGSSVFVPLTLNERGLAAGAAVPPPPPPPDSVASRAPPSPSAAPPQAAMGPRTRDAMRTRIQSVAHRARERLRADPRDTDAMFALAAAESILGHPIVSLGLLDRLEILDSEYPGLWDLKARLYAQLGDSSRWKTAKERADRAYEKPAPAPKGAAAHATPTEPDLIQQLDELVRSLAAMAVSEPAESITSAAAAEVAAEGAPEATARRPSKKEGRARKPAKEKKGFLDKLTGPFGSSPAARFGIPAAIIAILLLIPFLALSGILSPPPQAGGQATPTISGLNLNPLYGDVMGGTEMAFKVIVSQNSFQGARNVRPVITTANLAAGTDIVMVASLNNVTFTYADPVVTQNGTTFTYDFGTAFEQSVAAGATGTSAPTWYFQFHYAVTTLPASVITWHAQFVSG